MIGRFGYLRPMPRLIHLNGRSRVGKTTLARRYINEHPGTLALDLDVIAGMIGGWQEDFSAVWESPGLTGWRWQRAICVRGTTWSCRSWTVRTRYARGDDRAMCVSTVRYDGTVYRGWVHNPKDVQATKLGLADLADCDDTGDDSEGATFPANPDQVKVWAFKGLPTSEVTGVHSPDGFLAYVAEDVPTKEAEAIAAQLK
jgi:Family of unknown function (DUF6281)